MKFVARFTMVLVMVAFVVAIAMVWANLYIVGDTELIWDFMDQPVDLPKPPLWASLVALSVSIVTMAALGSAFWSIHRILQNEKSPSFKGMAFHLRRCAQGLLGFWLGLFLLTSTVPAMMLTETPRSLWPELEFVPIDIEIVFLVLSVALLAVSRELDRAHDIEDENKQFL